MKSNLLILDYGSQYTQLIARSIRELGVFCEIVPGNLSFERFSSYNPKAIILSGGPASVNIEGAPKIDQKILDLGLPTLGICYGMQLLTQSYGGKVGGWSEEKSDGAESSKREFGRAEIKISEKTGIFSAVEDSLEVWMSHGDKVTELPKGFKTLASSSGSPVAAFCNEEKKIYAVQFHPEVNHTPKGKDILSAFVFNVCSLEKDWNAGSFVTDTVEGIKKKVPTGNVVCGLSGGVDSTVAATSCLFAFLSTLNTYTPPWLSA